MKLLKRKGDKCYFCENCAKVMTEDEIKRDSTDRLAYGSTICNCEYGYLMWDNKSKSFIPVYGKSFVPMVEIPKQVYDSLHLEKNEIIRMRMYNSWKRHMMKGNNDRKG